MADAQLDTRGLECPLPVMKAAKAIQAVAAGGTLEILATDPGAVQDFEVFCETKGHALINSSESEGVYCFLIRKGG